jgi:hypothetical protein
MGLEVPGLALASQTLAWVSPPIGVKDVMAFKVSTTVVLDERLFFLRCPPTLLRYRDSFAACRRYPSATHSFGPALRAFLERINQMFYFR